MQQSKPFVGVIPDNFFTEENVQTLLQYDTLRGIIVVNSTVSENSRDSFFSPSPQTPQGYGTPSSAISLSLEYEWNPTGQSLTMLDLSSLPIVYVQDIGVSNYLIDVANDQSDDIYPAIVAEFNYYMGPPDSNSDECLSWIDRDGVWRPKCLPLGGNSVWATAGSNLNKQIDEDTIRETVMIAAAMDGSSFFHEITPSANEAASNILTVLSAAKLIGNNMNNELLDSLSKTISFALFQGESFGYIGSRSFLRDTKFPGFTCQSESTVYHDSESGKGAFEFWEDSCLQPLKSSLAFQKLGDISHMVAIDQVGDLLNENTLYVHAEDAGNEEAGSFVGSVLREMTTDSFTVQTTNAEAGDDDYFGVPIPPSPLTSLLRLSEGAAGGAVLTGYDTSFVNSRYQSHWDSNSIKPVNMEAIAAAATILARSAVAIAYDDGTGDYETSAQYAQNIIPALSDDDEFFVDLADCLFNDDDCTLWKRYVDVEQKNEYDRSGVDLGRQVGRGSRKSQIPNYFVNVYDANNGQAFVQVDKQWYGSYEGTEFGKHDDDTILMRPTALEAGIHGLFNDLLGRGHVDEESGVLKSCDSLADCTDVNDCDGSDYAVCTGGNMCVCKRAHYHTALDEAIMPALNDGTGKFVVQNGGNDDNEYLDSALYTEPNWSADVGVRIYRDAGDFGYWALFVGFLSAAGFTGASLYIKTALKKEKMY